MNRHQNHILAVASLSLGLLVAAPARAASLQKLDQSVWGGGTANGFPSYVNMYIYVPDQLATKPPIVVGPHSCQGNGTGTYGQMSSLVSTANKNGFIMIFPEATGQNCWDAGTDRSLNHSGKGDAPAIVQMVKYTLSKYSGDAGRVYSVGMSSGGIMTEALLGVFPDVFMAGVSIMGVPCGCWADGYNDVVGKPASGTGQWSGPCAGGTVSKTGQQWGDLVRSYFPGYTGHRPRLQHWHGTADSTLNYKNMAEDIKEWTNLLGLSETPTGTDTPTSGTTHQFWKNSCYTVYETFSEAGVGHAIGFDGNAVGTYFGLDKAGGQDPETVACPGAVPGGGGGGGGGGAGGATGSGGTTGDGGVGGKGGSSASGGSSSASGGNSAASGGNSARGGSPSSGGTVQTGGNSASGGSSASGGATSNGGTVASGGSSASGGSASGGATPSSGGTTATGGSPASGGRSSQSSGGAQASGGTIGTGGSSGGGGSTTGGGNGSSGCSYALGAHDSGAGTAALLMLALGLLLRRRVSRTS
jgi:poly(hydroxyalkanoate) depolymerase family esterase